MIKKRGFGEYQDAENSSSVRRVDDDADTSKSAQVGSELFRIDGVASAKNESQMRESTTDNDEGSSQSAGGSCQDPLSDKNKKVT